MLLSSRRTSELTGRGDYIQPSIQSIKLRKRLSALRSNDLFGGRSWESDDHIIPPLRSYLSSGLDLSG
jgi:hypothetical protein